MWLGSLTFCVCRTLGPIHFDQEIFLFCHSYRSPTPKMESRPSVSHDFLMFHGSRGKDSTRVISRSNITNSSEIRKNWNENGKGVGFMVLNPHSNWFHESFFL